MPRDEERDGGRDEDRDAEQDQHQQARGRERRVGRRVGGVSGVVVARGPRVERVLEADEALRRGVERLGRAPDVVGRDEIGDRRGLVDVGGPLPLDLLPRLAVGAVAADQRLAAAQRLGDGGRVLGDRPAHGLLVGRDQQALLVLAVDLGVDRGVVDEPDARDDVVVDRRRAVVQRAHLRDGDDAEYDHEDEHGAIAGKQLRAHGQAHRLRILSWGTGRTPYGPLRP
jgi:hypothetical protein